METILSAAVSLDGCLDDRSPQRLRLSGPEDWTAVRELRATCDAILVGAGTVRADDPSLSETPLRVVVSRSGDLPADARIFAAGEVLVLAGREFTAREIVAELAARGCRRLLVEGGSTILTMFLREGVADRLRLAVAPFLVGDPDAPRLVCGGDFPWNKDRRMTLAGVERLGDMAVMWYKL